MKNLQKIGGVAALIGAAAWVVGIGLGFTILAPYVSGELDSLQEVAFLADNQGIVYIWNLIIYVVFSVFLVVLSLALHDRLKAGSPAMVQTATAFWLIWAGLVLAIGMVANSDLGAVVDLYGKDPAQATSMWLTLDAVETGLGGGETIAGSLWVLLVGWAALRAGGLPKPLNYFGVVIRLTGILSTIVPALEVVGIVFGLGFIVWLAWLGIVMLRSSTSATA